jgi:hypothetical protein
MHAGPPCRRKFFRAQAPDWSRGYEQVLQGVVPRIMLVMIDD